MKPARRFPRLEEEEEKEEEEEAILRRRIPPLSIVWNLLSYPGAAMVEMPLRYTWDLAGEGRSRKRPAEEEEILRRQHMSVRSVVRSIIRLPSKIRKRSHCYGVK